MMKNATKIRDHLVFTTTQKKAKPLQRQIEIVYEETIQNWESKGNVH